MKNKLRFSSMLLLSLVFSFAVFGQYSGENPNVAVNKLVVASDSIVGFEPGLAVDEDVATAASIPGNAPAWIEIALGKFYKIDGYSLLLNVDTELPKAFQFQVSQDGNSWTTADAQTVTEDGEFAFTISETDPADHVRIYMTAKDALAKFAEIAVYGEELLVPDPPVPTEATNITMNSFTAHWNPVAEADGYVITVALDDNYTSFPDGWDQNGKWTGSYTTYVVENLEPGTEYFYKVRSYNKAGTSNFGLTLSASTLQGTQTISFAALDTVVYGDADFALTATASSGLPVSYLASNDTVVTISGSTVTIVGAGTTTITASQAGDDQYLAAADVSQTLFVRKKALTVTGAKAADKAYDGTTDAVISGAVLDGVVGDDDVNLTGATEGVFAQAGVGADLDVAVQMGISGDDETNYVFTAPTGLTASITQAELTVLADDKSREECADNPDFTLSYAGFVNDEDVSVIDTAPTVSCEADAGSADGDYDIVVSGGQDDNYSFVYANGTLTVTPDATNPTLLVKDATLDLDENDEGTLTAEDVVSESSDNCGIVSTTLSKTDFTLDDVGTVNVDVTVADETGNTTTETAVVTVKRTTGISDREVFRGFYPNPTSGIVHLQLSSMAEELVVIDMTGKTVMRKLNVAENALIDLSECQSGLYVFQLKFEGKVKQFRVVKN